MSKLLIIDDAGLPQFFSSSAAQACGRQDAPPPRQAPSEARESGAGGQSGFASSSESHEAVWPSVSLAGGRPGGGQGAAGGRFMGSR